MVICWQCCEEQPKSSLHPLMPRLLSITVTTQKFECIRKPNQHACCAHVFTPTLSNIFCLNNTHALECQRIPQEWKNSYSSEEALCFKCQKMNLWLHARRRWTLLNLSHLQLSKCKMPADARTPLDHDNTVCTYFFQGTTPPHRRTQKTSTQQEMQQ